MVKMVDVKQLQTGIPGSSPEPMPGGEDWLSRINSTINNFKELVKLGQSFRNANTEVSTPVAMSQDKGRPGLDKNAIVKYLDIAISQGYGTKTIGEILTRASPITLEQLKEFLKRV